MYRSTLSILLITALSFTSCKKTAALAEESSSTDVSNNIFVFVEREINGLILGQTFKEPTGITIGRDGTVFIVDRGNNRVVRFDSEMNPEKQIGGYGHGTELFNRPSFAAMDNGLNLFVSDEGNRRVARFDARLNFVDEIRFEDEEDPFKFGYPSGIGITSYGEIWIADNEKNRLCVFNNISKFDRFIGDFGSSGGQMLSPEKIVKDDAGNFFVCDAGHSRIVVYDEFGSHLRTYAFNQINYPISIAIADDMLWVLDGGDSKLFSVSKNGKVLSSFGPNLPGTNLSLKQPSDIALLEDDRLVIVDTGNNRLLICRIVKGEAK
ncbi:MAG: NHL repeat-containing protein [candidate division Zixibacteria bacterium]|nr:NHL repeat-containing protein [candidate division Zixibacteria bacterium]